MSACSDERGDLTQCREIVKLRGTQREPFEERKHPCFEIGRSRHFEVEHSVTTTSHRPYGENLPQKLRSLWADLRHVEGQCYTPRQSPIALSTDGNVEASFT